MRRMGREKGQGTIVPIARPEGASPRWRVAVTMADGRRVWRNARSPREAERIRRQLVEMRELDLDPTRQTLADWLRSWTAGLADARNQRVRPRTLDHYRLVVERHIIPGLGSLKLSAVTARRVQEWVDADTGSPMTVRHHHAVLRRSLNVAVRQRLLAYNPANAVELPEANSDVGMPLTAAEARALLSAAEGDPSADPPVPPDPLRALWRLAIVSGLRQGELLGLAWDDLEDGRLTVRYQMQRLISDSERAAARAAGRKPVGSWVRTAPKAARSVTRVSLDAGTVAALEAHRVRQAAARTDSWRYFGHMFLTPSGDPIHGAELLSAFKAACRRAGIPERRFHDLRGSSATLMREAGVAEDTRMARLGHSTVEMSRHYAKASEAQDQDAADRIGRAIG